MSPIARLLARASEFDATTLTSWCTAGEFVDWIANGFLRTLLEASDGALVLEGGALELCAPPIR